MNSAAALPSLVPSGGYRRLPSLAQPRLIGLLSAALCAGSAALLGILALTGMRPAPEFANFLVLAAAVAVLAGYCRWRGHPWLLTDSAAVVAVVTVSLLLCGLVSCTGLRLGLPLADQMLAWSDALLGFDVGRVARFVATQPAISELLHFAYNSSGVLCVAVLGWSLVKRDRLLMWRVVATITVAMQLTAIVSILFPARGAAVALGLDALQGQGLPFGAGTYSAAEFAHFYSGDELLVRLADMNGIVCFPSFHTVMALVVLQGFATSPLRWPAVVWSALTIVSTVPMGGHYVTDLAGGIAVWIVACRLATWACRFPERDAGTDWPGPRLTRLIRGLRAT
ncbi:MAG TPA: phosphatase PAP2 family protein [Croceibacterium sp.]|nr:phosphatase PAP2 family protein [Croceibacterium sp.]